MTVCTTEAESGKERKMEREELIDHIKSGLEELSAAELIEVYSCCVLHQSAQTETPRYQEKGHRETQ